MVRLIAFYKQFTLSGTTSTENAESGTENTTASNNSTGSPQSANKEEKVNRCPYYSNHNVCLNKYILDPFLFCEYTLIRHST